MLNFIINPKSGNGKGAGLTKAIEKYCVKNSVEYKLWLTTAKGDGEKYAHEITEEDPEAKIVAVGGDGTFHEVLNGLVCPDRSTLGFIPAGRGNDFARAAKLSRKIDEAMRTIVGGKTKFIDYINCENKRCLNVAGTGLDIDVLERVDGHKGNLKYIASLLYCIKHFTPYKIRVEINGTEEEYDCIMAGVCNGVAIGGGMTLSPISKIDDGVLDVIVMTMPEDGKIMKVLPKFVSGKHMDMPITHHFKCEKVKVTSYSGKPVQLDGEIYRDITLDCEIAAGGLKIFTE